jgi:hypothetical protein
VKGLYEPESACGKKGLEEYVFRVLGVLEDIEVLGDKNPGFRHFEYL